MFLIWPTALATALFSACAGFWTLKNRRRNKFAETLRTLSETIHECELLKETKLRSFVIAGAQGLIIGIILAVTGIYVLNFSGFDFSPYRSQIIFLTLANAFLGSLAAASAGWLIAQ